MDVEGSELDILRTIPFDKVDVKVIDIEFKKKRFSPKFQELDDLLRRNGFQFVVETKDPFGRPNDLIYVKKGFKEELDNISNSKVLL